MANCGGPDYSVLSTFDVAARASLRQLLAKTCVVVHDEAWSTVVVDGRSATRLAHKGHHEAPLSNAELAAKWRLLNPEAEPPLHLLEPECDLSLR